MYRTKTLESEMHSNCLSQCSASICSRLERWKREERSMHCNHETKKTAQLGCQWNNWLCSRAYDGCMPKSCRKNLLVIWRAELVPSVQNSQGKMAQCFARTQLHNITIHKLQFVASQKSDKWEHHNVLPCVPSLEQIQAFLVSYRRLSPNGIEKLAA